jgi:hypothetical protein
VNVHKELYDSEHTKILYECVANIISLHELLDIHKKSY